MNTQQTDAVSSPTDAIASFLHVLDKYERIYASGSEQRNCLNELLADIERKSSWTNEAKKLIVDLIELQIVSLEHLLTDLHFYLKDLRILAKLQEPITEQQIESINRWTRWLSEDGYIAKRFEPFMNRVMGLPLTDLTW
jgi:hypothetical protein